MFAKAAAMEVIEAVGALTVSTYRQWHIAQFRAAIPTDETLQNRTSPSVQAFIR